MAKTHCAVNHHLRARQRVPHISTRRMQPMLPFPSDVELPPPTQFEQFCSFLGLYLMLLGLDLAPFAAPLVCGIVEDRFSFPAREP